METNMKRLLLIGVAAGALLAGMSAASAQGMSGASGGAMEQRGSSGASMDNKGSGAEQKGHARPEMKADTPAGKARAQAPDNMKADTKGKADTKADQGTKAKDAQKQDAQKQDDKSRNAQSKPDSNKSGTSAQGDTKSSTTAQGSDKNAGGAKANLTVEQKTKIRETVIKSSNAPRVTNVNFSISVGTVIPRTVRFAPLPPVLVEFYPSWRGYDYVIVEERIVIIEPSSFKIVAVLDV
jgi:hypothetical protein